MSDSVFTKMPVGQRVSADGTQPHGRAGRTFEQMVSQVHGRYTEQASRGNIFFANTLLTGKVIWSTEAATGGPVLWNGSSTHVAAILGIGFGVYLASNAAVAFGLTGGYDQNVTFATSTAISSECSTLIGSTVSRVSAFSSATTNTNRWFMPLGSLTTEGLDTTDHHFNWIDLGGMIVLPQYSFVSPAVSAAATDVDMEITIVWEEVPV